MGPFAFPSLPLAKRGPNGLPTTTSKDALLLATGVVGTAFVASHVYFFLRSRSKRVNASKSSTLCAFLRLLGLSNKAEVHYDKATGRLCYPSTARVPVVDTLHGTAVPDPYRWLEDPDAKDVQKWVNAQNKVTDAYFKACLQEDKLKFQSRMSELFHYDKFSCVWQKGSRYFFYKKTGLQNQAVLYTQDTLSSPPRMLIDPNTLRADGTAALSSVHVTEDGNTLAYMISLSGSDWQTIYTMDVVTGKALPDEVHWCKYSSVTWTRDGQGFFYNKYLAPTSKGKEDGAGTETDAAASQMVYYHRLGTDEKEDVLFWHDPSQPKWMYGVEIADDGETLLLTSNDSCDPVNRLYYFDLRGFDGRDMKSIGRCVRLVDTLAHRYDYVTNEGRKFYFLTNSGGAGNYKIVRAELPAPGDVLEEDKDALAKSVTFVDVVPEDSKGGVLTRVQPVAGRFLLLSYLRNVTDELELCFLDREPVVEAKGGQGKAEGPGAISRGPARLPVSLPGTGTVDSLCARKETAEFFFKFSSFSDPGTVYRAEIRFPEASADAAGKGSGGGEGQQATRGQEGTKAGGSRSPESSKAKGKKKKGGKKEKASTQSDKREGKDSEASDLLALVEVPKAVLFRAVIPGLNPEEFTTTQVFYQSKDGTKVPMFLVRGAEGSKMNGGPERARPTFLYGYGGFNISIRPSFSLSRLLFIQHYGGLVAVANIRGGGEYGENWHTGGTKGRKQNVFDDFVAAAEYLIKEGLSTPAQLAINGGSNGGLLVAACINQRPDLFGAAVAQVGVLDMLRFHKFTIGYAWCSDYGNADEDEADFKNLLGYSPIHNVNKEEGVTYPATLITTGDHDDRVVPLHSYKYIAALQHAHGDNPAQTRPLIIRIDTKAGHGAGKPTSKVIEEQSDVMAFIAKNTGATWQD
ncbi:prolyl endopeptidase [Nannochloropsis gaditana]|uniref:prolyl oligopeptidase n=1 Tax=Nannochloropsis gaditana TaxID=72520 RepID=W7TH20_9STRA|nr:prolyl endopeptidase [Nannochloropsis gaditana]